MKTKNNNNQIEEEDPKYGKKSEQRVGNYSEAPEYIKDNEYIKRGYRVNCNSVKKVAKSLFYLHNESVNVWSHLLGTITVIILIVYTAIFITSYNIQLGNVISHVKQLNNLSSIAEMPFAQTISNFTSNFFQGVSNKLDFSYYYRDYIENINIVLSNIKNSTTNFTDSISDIIDDVSYKLSDLQEKLLELMEMERLPLDSNIYSSSNRNLKRWPIFVMLTSAIICLSFSALFHLMGTLSKETFNIFSRLDYAGISLLIAGSCYPPYFYFFHCEPFLRNAYLTFITAFAVSVFLYSLTSDFHIPERRTLRGSLFLCLGLSASIPIFHLVFFKNSVRGFEAMPRLIFWYIGGISYVSGALMYINRIPERFKPGNFDIFGSSHQIFHCLIVVGVITHYLGCLDSYYYRIENSCPAN